MATIVLDCLLAGVLLASIIVAARNGVTRELARIAALVLGALFAMWGHGLLGRELQVWIPDPRLASGAAFVLILLGCLLAGALVARVLVGVWSLTGMDWFDKLLGGVFGALRGLLFGAAALLAFLVFEPIPNSSHVVGGSRIAPLVMHIARTMASFAPEGFREAFVKVVDGDDREAEESRI